MKLKKLLFLLPLIGTLVWAQSVDPAKFAEIQKQNAAALHKYTWKQRIELQVKGETKKVMLNLMRYDADGKQQKTLLSEESPDQQAKQDSGRHPRLKEKIVEKKKEDFKEMTEGIAALIQSYAHVPPDKLKASMAKAEKLPPAAGMENAIGLRLSDVLQPKDSMTIWIDKGTMFFREVDISSFYEEKPVTVNAKYSLIPDGPSYMAKAVLQYPDKNLQVRIDNFEYTYSASESRAPARPQPAATTAPPPDTPPQKFEGGWNPEARKTQKTRVCDTG